jgi:FkbM family methyltransferase
MKKIFLIIARIYLRYFNFSDRARDLLLWPIASRVFGRDYSTTIELAGGPHLRVDLGDTLGRLALFYGDSKEYFWEPQTTRLIKILLRPGSRALVAGAHIGYSALMVGKFTRGGEVATLEPVRYLYEAARENFLLNKDVANFYLERAALSDMNGEAEIAVDNLRSTLMGADKIKTDGAAPQMERVPTKTIPALLGELKWDGLDFILLDVEGYEFKVLRGAHDLLKGGAAPDIIFEYNPPLMNGLTEARAMNEYLAAFGYHLYIIDDNYDLLGSRLAGEDVIRLFSWESGLRAFAAARSFNILAIKDVKRLAAPNIQIIND